MATLEFIQTWGGIGVGVIAAGSIVTGARIALSPGRSPRATRTVTRIFAFGTGAFVTAVCLDFLPDAWSGNGHMAAYWILLGALFLWIANQVSDWVFEGLQTQTTPGVHSRHEEHHSLNLDPPLLPFTRLSAWVLAGALSFHTFLEGGSVALAFHAPNWDTLGFSLAVILHKLPEGVLWGIALASVFPESRAQVNRLLLIPAVCSVVGVLLGEWLGHVAPVGIMNAMTGILAGSMLYIAFTELLPALRDSVYPLESRTWFLCGVFVMFAISAATTLFGLA